MRRINRSDSARQSSKPVSAPEHPPPKSHLELLFWCHSHLRKRFGHWPALGIGLGIGVVVVGLACWYGALGLAPQRILVANFGPPPFVLNAIPSVRLDYTIGDSADVQRPGFFQADCRSGDRIVITAKLLHPAYLLIFGWDGHAPYHFSNHAMDPQLVEGELSDFVTLDEETGIETFYAIAADHPFSFSRDIQPRLSAQPVLASKGGQPSLFPLVLPPEFGQALQQCRHIAE